MHTCMLSHFSRVQLFATLWTITHQVPLSMGFSRQEYWSGLPCPPPGDLPNPGIEPASLESPALAGRFLAGYSSWDCRSRTQLSTIFFSFFTTSTTWEAPFFIIIYRNSIRLISFYSITFSRF